MRLHIQQTARSSHGLNTQRSVGAVGKSGRSHLQGFTNSETDATVYLGGHVVVVVGEWGGLSLSHSSETV